VITLEVIGTPAPQGSKSFKGLTGSGRAILAESSAKVRPWREAVTLEAYQARLRARCAAFCGPVWVSMVFSLRRPVSAPRRVVRPVSAPDLSKLARCVEDSLTDAGMWGSDAQVVEYVRLAKVFAGGDDPDAMDVPGVRVTVYDAPLVVHELRMLR
jgi:Holliday junction resolvase RusA-like endonuclease